MAAGGGVGDDWRWQLSTAVRGGRQ